MKRVLGILVALGWGGAILAQDALKPVVESVEGEKIIIIKSKDGTRPGTIGSVVDYGESILTGPRSTVKVKYPDGSKLLIGVSTQMEVTRPKEDGESTSTIHNGKIRALIKNQKGKQRFMFRTQSAVLGVRGTDFTFESSAQAQTSQVHTLKGVVEVGEDEEVIQSGQGVPIGEGETIKGDASGLGKVETFDRNQYIGDLEKSQPGFKN